MSSPNFNASTPITTADLNQAAAVAGYASAQDAFSSPSSRSALGSSERAAPIDPVAFEVVVLPSSTSSTLGTATGNPTLDAGVLSSPPGLSATSGVPHSGFTPEVKDTTFASSTGSALPTTAFPSSHVTGGGVTDGAPQTDFVTVADTKSTPSSSTPAAFGSVTGNHPQHEQPNIPATAERIAAAAPSAEQIKEKGAAFVDQSAALAEQAKIQAGELVAPKDKSELNATEEHVDKLSSGIAGMIVTAPLAGIEKISPVVADKLSVAGANLSAQLQTAASQAGPVASSYAQQATDYARGVLPTALGGRPATTATTGPTVAEQASAVTEKTTATLGNAGQSVQAAVSSAGQTVASTAQAYLPASIANKLPGVGATTDTTTTASKVESPYVPLSQDKPTSVVPADTLRDLGGDKDLTPDFSSSTATSAQYSGLQSSTDKDTTPAFTSASGSTTQFSGLQPSTTDQLPAQTASHGSAFADTDRHTSSATHTSVEKPTLGAPMYTKDATSDYKTDQTNFAPAEYAAEKHSSA